MPPQDEDNIRPGEPTPRRAPQGEFRERRLSRADRMEERRGVYRKHDELSMADLRAVAFYQKVLILCILAMIFLYIGAGVLRSMAEGSRPGMFVIPQVALAVAILAVGITSTVFVFMLAIKVYNVAVGILLGILTILPCLGLLVLLIINSQATTILRRNGVHVGFLGARKRDLDELENEEMEAEDDLRRG